MKFRTDEEAAKWLADMRSKYGDGFFKKLEDMTERLVKDGEAILERRRRREAKRLAGGGNGSKEDLQRRLPYIG